MDDLAKQPDLKLAPTSDLLETELSKIDSFLHSERLIDTASFRQVAAALERVRGSTRRAKTFSANGGALTLLTGAYGVGKTTILRYYAVQADLIYFEFPSNARGAKDLMMMIYQSMPELESGDAWHIRRSAVLTQLKESPKVFCIDEAQRMNEQCFDLLRYLTDQTGSRAILSAAPSLEARIAKWPAIDSRVGRRIRVKPVELNEAVEILAPLQLDEEVACIIYKQASGSIRIMENIVNQLGATLEDQHDSGNAISLYDLSPEDVHAIAAEVVRRGGNS